MIGEIKDPTVMIETATLPFGGLGFDLSPAAERAMMLCLDRVGSAPSGSVSNFTFPPVFPSGYDRLIYLSREIRGR